MNQKLEQLRRRYANQGRVAEAPETYTLGPSSIEDEHLERPISDGQEGQSNSSAGQKPASDGDARLQSKPGPSPVEASQISESVRAIAALFEPARRYRERVSRSFEAIHALRAELQVLAESVDPLKDLEGGVMEIVEMLRTQLSDLAMTMEAAKALRLQLSVLGQAPEAGSELEAKIRELSNTLNSGFDEKASNDKRMLIEKKSDAN
jgi:hypothetical protein